MSKAGVSDWQGAVLQVVVIQGPGSSFCLYVYYFGSTIFSVWLLCHYAHLKEAGERRKNTEYQEMFCKPVLEMVSYHLCAHFIGQNSVICLHQAARAAGNLGGVAWDEEE